MASIQVDRSARRVLADVPRVGFYRGGDRCPEGVPFPSALRACLEYLGADYGARQIVSQGSVSRLDNLYTFLMGASGAAFRLSWGTNWTPDNVEITYMSDEPGAPFHRALDAVGYRGEWAMLEDDHASEAASWRGRIVASIDAGVPVIAFGIIGPPEACVIAGYDEGGDVLIGWNFFQDFPEYAGGIDVEQNGMFRARDWHGRCEGLLFLGTEIERPPLGATYRSALRWALDVARTPVVTGYGHDRANGLAAYEAWAAAIRRNGEFPDDISILRARYAVHDDAVGLVAEARCYGAQFLRAIAAHEPAMADKLLRAVASFEAEHDLMWEIWRLAGGTGRSDERARAFADPELRRRTAEIILRARAEDAAAMGHIERALAIDAEAAREPVASPAGGSSVRRVLDGVPKIHFYEGGEICPEDFGLPSVVRACLQYLGDPVVGCNARRLIAPKESRHLGCTYAHVMLASGMAFQQTWHPARREYSGDVLRFAPDAIEPFRRAFAAVGRECTIVGNPAACAARDIDPAAFPVSEVEPALRARIIASIDAGVPVVALGIIGPPEACIVAGYDERGDVLVGWNFFQGFPEYAAGIDIEPNGMFRRRDWFAATPGIILIGARMDRPPLKDFLREALAWNLALMRAPEVRGRATGLAALDAWAEAMRRDADFPDDVARLREAYGKHHDMIGVVAEGRWYASLALAQIAAYEPEPAEHLLAAAACCAAIHDLMWKIWNMAGGIGEDEAKVRTGTAPAARREIADLIIRARAKDAEAATHLDRVLAG